MNPRREGEDWQERLEAGRLDPQDVAGLRARLRDRPSESAELEKDLALNSLLDRLPRIDPPSNLASRVLQQIEREDRQSARRPGRFGQWWVRWHLLRSATITAAAAMLLTAWWQFRLHQRRTLADSLTAITHVAAEPGVEFLRDFDAIRLLPTTPQPSDVELIAALNSP